MPLVTPFDALHDRYELWFEEHEAACVSELLALRAFVPREGRGLDIGVGTGRFAAPLGVQVGLDPSSEMPDSRSAGGARPYHIPWPRYGRSSPCGRDADSVHL